MLRYNTWGAIAIAISVSVIVGVFFYQFSELAVVIVALLSGLITALLLYLVSEREDKDWPL